MPSATPSQGSAPAARVPTAHAATAASRATGASRPASPASATGTLRSATHRRAAACAAATTRTARGASGRQGAHSPGTWQSAAVSPNPPDCPPPGVPSGTLGTRRWALASTAGPAPALMDLAAPGTSLPPATRMGAPGRLSATAAPGTQVSACCGLLSVRSPVPRHCSVLCANRSPL